MTEKIGCVQHDCDECKARLAQPTSGDYALGYAEGFNDACKRQPVRSGWPAGLLQDDDRKLSKWLASKPDAKHVVDMAQSEQNDRQLQIAMRQWEDWKAYALDLQKKLVKYEGGSPMILNTQPKQEPVGFAGMERPWVGLTREEINSALSKYASWYNFAAHLENILKEKNQ